MYLPASFIVQHHIESAEVRYEQKDFEGPNLWSSKVL